MDFPDGQSDTWSLQRLAPARVECPSWLRGAPLAPPIRQLWRCKLRHQEKCVNQECGWRSDRG